MPQDVPLRRPRRGYEFVSVQYILDYLHINKKMPETIPDIPIPQKKYIHSFEWSYIRHSDDWAIIRLHGGFHLSLTFFIIIEDGKIVSGWNLSDYSFGYSEKELN